MKTLTGIHEKLNPPRDQEIFKGIEVSDVLTDSLYYSFEQGPGSAIKQLRCLELAIKIGEHPLDRIELEEAEFELLRKKVEENPAKYLVWAVAPVLLRLKECNQGG